MDTFGTGTKCPSSRELNKGSKERQGTTLSVRFTEVSVKRESTVLEMVIPLTIKRRDFFNETAFLFWCHAL